MVRIEVIVRPSKLEDVRQALEDAGHSGITVMDVKGAGKQKGYTQHYRGSEYEVNLLPKVYLMLVVPDDACDRLVDVIVEAAATGEVGDGKIFLSQVFDSVRIRTGDRGESAVR